MTVIDTAGREWLIRIDFNALKRVRDALGADFGQWNEVADLLVKLRLNDLFVGEVARWILDPELRQRNIDAENFYASVNGDCIEKFCTAIEDGLQSFFRNEAVRMTVVQQITTARRLTSGSLLTNLPGESESTPGTSPPQS